MKEFVIRLREDMHETEDDGGFNFARCYASSARDSGWLPGMARTPENPLRFEGRKIKGGELVLVVGPLPEEMACLLPKSDDTL